MLSGCGGLAVRFGVDSSPVRHAGLGSAPAAGADAGASAAATKMAAFRRRSITSNHRVIGVGMPMIDVYVKTLELNHDVLCR